MKRWIGFWLTALIIGITHAEVYPPEYWALRSAIDSVELSPDGNRLAIMKIPAKDANPIIEVYNTDQLDAEPFRINADPMEIIDFSMVSNDHLIFRARQQVRDMIEGFNRGVYETRLVLVDIKDKKLKEFDEAYPAIEGLLPNDPRRVIISFSEGGDEGAGAKLSRAFRPRAYWALDLERRTKKLLIRGKIALGQIDFDADGNPILARGFDIDKGDYVWYYREPEQDEWTEFYRLSEDSFDNFSVWGLDLEKPGHFVVSANNGNDKIGLWSYSAREKAFKELLYRRTDVDVSEYGAAVFHSNRWQHYDQIVGVRYATDTLHVEYFDEAEGALFAQLQSIVPNAEVVRVASRSSDGNSLVVYNSGAHDPGTYYLIRNGRFSILGSTNPLLQAESLADVRYIQYPARDGKTIHGYITVPNGEGPFPLVVMPHGGPFVAEVPLFDEWAQLLANHGYLVLQPQYRGSRGYGQGFYLSAFNAGGQGGYKMQDDKDDGVDYLIKEGLATAGNVAMFGWSYGGYAALVAASRKDQRYNCVIAGAAVADTDMQVDYYRYALRGAGKTEQLRMWDDSVAPIDEVANVNVPMLIIHGDVDQRVPVDHAREYREALDRVGKEYRYVELEGADHFSNTLFYHHKLKLYTELLAYLDGRCGLK